ncbi:MAG: hypothetical protein AMJ78_08530 [Omnitrophica WOR_2 bacterium SM23_29]|nr:MAG: hypothetical protein AMJ78_08530 [Omnitrophica WOR_2 bacterium SM23_29]
MIEIVVVIAIFAIFSGMLFTVFKSSLDSWRRAENLLDTYQSARLALEQMSGQISAALLDQTASDTGRWASFYGNDETGTRIKTNTAKDEIFFVAPVENEGDMDLCEIGYWLRSTDNMLMRHYQKFDSADDLPITYDFTNYDSDEQLAANITDLQFIYYYRATADGIPDTTTNTWDSTQNLLTNYDAKGDDKNPDGLPEAVGITIVVQESNPINPASPKTWTFTTLVAIEGVK